MFRQLYWRLTGLLLAVVLTAVVLTGGIYGITAVSAYLDDFSGALSAVAQSELPQTIHTILNASDAGADEAEPARLEAAVNAYAGVLGLDENRSAFVLSARDGSVLSPGSLRPEVMQETDNLAAAMRGGIGDKRRLFGGSLDYALFIRNGNNPADGAIFYVRDNKTDFIRTLHRLLFALLIALLVGIGLAMAGALLMTRFTMRPLRHIAQRAERFVQGNFEPSLEKAPSGELGVLVKAFDQMGAVMHRSLKQNQAEKHKIEAILEHVNNGIIAFDVQQNIVHINPAAKRMLRIQDVESVRFDRLFRSLDAGVCMAEFLYLDRTATEERDLLVDTNHIKAYFVPFRTDESRVAGVVCVFEDVTEQFNLEAARQKFVAEVSHELKTPLTTIRTYIETLMGGYLDDKRTATTLLSTVQNETDKMTALVQNLLILNRFDMQRVQIEREYFSVDDMLRSLVNMFSLEAEQKGISLTYNRTTDIPKLYADQGQIERAVKNIISNSIKYSSRGDRIQIFAGSLYAGGVYIKVEDTGKGIPKADLEHVFERFYRVDKARSRDRGGTGLGLAITKEIIESHGGTIEIESEFGRFTRVTVNLPAAEEAEA